MKVFSALVFLLAAGLAWAADPPAPLRWKAVLMTGYATDGNGGPLANWDNARETLQGLLLARGLEPGDLRVLTDDPRRVGTRFRGTVLGQSSRHSLREALGDLAPGPGEGLILFLSSHGQRNAGFLLESEGEGDTEGAVLTPADLAADLGALPGGLPMVILISACFSGQFLDGAAGVTGPARVVLAAARKDRSSFGCGAGADMPEWDESLLRLWSLRPSGFDWSGLARDLADDIAAKEADLGDRNRSYPQAAVGADVRFGGP